MKRFALSMAAFAATILASTTWAGEDKAKPQVRLEIDLVDGSHIIGVPSIDSVPVQTSYAKMDIPLKQLIFPTWTTAIAQQPRTWTASSIPAFGEETPGAADYRFLQQGDSDFCFTRECRADALFTTT